MPADVLVENHGSIALLTPVTPDARQWIDEHVQLEGWQWLDCSFACEPRCVDQLIEGMRDYGLTVE